LRIEFPPELLHEVRLEGARVVRPPPLRWTPPFNRVVNQSSGLLFGVRHDDEVRVLTARAESGLAPVGIFVCRARGEVFLTDDDLADFEKHHGILALVIAGGQAGFFVREPDGSVQAIRSHEEFQVADAAAHPVSRETAAVELPRPAPRWWQARSAWKRVAACAGLLAIPAGAFAYLRPLLPHLPIALALREDAGQLVIGWNAGAILEGSRLEIRDGSERTILTLAAGTSGATYGLQSGDVEVGRTTAERTYGRGALGSGSIRHTYRTRGSRRNAAGVQRATGPDQRANARSAEIASFSGRGAGARGKAGGESGSRYTRTVNALSERSTGRYSVSRSTGSRPASVIRRINSPRRRFWLVVAPAS
jgi:hypothetical protein